MFLSKFRHPILLIVICFQVGFNPSVVANFLDLPPIIEQHQSLNGLSVIDILKKILSPECTQKIAYLGTYKLHSNIKNAQYITDIIRDYSRKKSEDCEFKVFSENRLADVERRELPALAEGPGWVTLKEAAGPFLVDNFPAVKNAHFKILLTENYFSVGTTNFDGEFDPERPYCSRDFTTFITDPALINEGITVFKDLFAEKQPNILLYNVHDIKFGETRLSWGPWHHKQHILDLIKNSTVSIDIYQQDLQDLDIVNALVDQLKKVKVRILMSGYPFSKEHGNKNLGNLRRLKEEGAIVLLTGEKAQGQFFDKPLHIHAKVLMCDAGTDQQIMYLGSANFYPDVLDVTKKNLNIGIITRDDKFVEPVRKFFQADWQDHVDFDKASLDYWTEKIHTERHVK